jgi:FkbM family methyltransferase
MTRDNWVKALGLDADGRLFVDIDNGIRLYDFCLDTSLPAAVRLRPQDLMRAENRRLYYRFLTTLKEIDDIMFQPSYDDGCPIKKGDVVVDAGARIGTFAAKIAAAVGNEGKIIAIEPEPRNFDCLLKNIAANKLGNVVAVRKMLWSGAGNLDLYLSGNSASHSAYLDGFYGPTGESVSVEADTLDGILNELRVGPVDFVKMDIEGSEIEALKGMKSVLENAARLAIAAYHPVQGRLTHTVIIPQLEQLGFKVTYADGIIRTRKDQERPNVGTLHV